MKKRMSKSSELVFLDGLGVPYRIIREERFSPAIPDEDCSMGDRIMWVRVGFVVIVIQVWSRGRGFEVYVPTPMNVSDAAKVVKDLAKTGL